MTAQQRAEAQKHAAAQKKAEAMQKDFLRKALEVAHKKSLDSLKKKGREHPSRTGAWTV